VGNEIYDNSARSPFQTSGIAFFKPFGDDGDGFENIVAGNKVYRNENLVPNPVHGITDGNCIIIDNTRWPRSEYEYPGETLIENNVCFDNGGRGIHVLKADDVYVVNNTLIQNLRTEEIIGGELSADDARNVIFQNNLVWARDADDSQFLVRSESVAFENNGYVFTDGDGDVEDSAIILSDPGLVNASLDPLEFDPRLAPNSEALGQGVANGAPSVTYDGMERPAIPSLGALELAPS
jgi:parallel beta-helix repeat protein